MKIGEQDVRYVAELANLALAPSEISEFQQELSAILEYIDQLSELDTSSVEPMSQAALHGAANAALRPDERRDCLPHEAALSNAPLHDENFFRVPKVIER